MPTFDHLRTNLLDEETTAWFTDLLDVIERLDASAYASKLTQDAEQRLPDGAVLHGRDVIAAALHPSWSALASLEHSEINLYGDRMHIVSEARVVMTTSDGQTIESSVTSWVDRQEDGHVTSARTYG